MNNMKTLIELFYKVLEPGDKCITRILFRDLDLGIVRQNPWSGAENRIHQGQGPISNIDHSAEVILFGFTPEEVKEQHKAFVPNTTLQVRTIFFKDGRKMVRLYNKDVDWKGDRHKIDLIEFLKRTNELDGDYTLQCLEKFMYGVV